MQSEVYPLANSEPCQADNIQYQKCCSSSTKLLASIIKLYNTVVNGSQKPAELATSVGLITIVIVMDIVTTAIPPYNPRRS